MKWYDKLGEYLRQRVKYTASNPDNFEVQWTLKATRTQVLSLILLIVLLIGFLAGLFVLKGPMSSYFSKNDVSIERSKLEEQYLKIKALNKKIEDQENYLQTVRRIISGETIEDSLNSELPEVAETPVPKMESEPTEAEKEISEKVKNDLRTGSVKKKNKDLPFFSAPVKGVISQKFDPVNHPGIDVVTGKGQTVLACLSGTVVYAGYTQKDGYVAIIDHANGYISVYKHNKALLKKAGSKVQLNDPISIVGNTGENSTGPHLHFELWYNQTVVNPSDYINFKN